MRIDSVEKSIHYNIELAKIEVGRICKSYCLEVVVNWKVHQRHVCKHLGKFASCTNESQISIIRWNKKCVLKLKSSRIAQCRFLQFLNFQIRFTLQLKEPYISYNEKKRK